MAKLTFTGLDGYIAQLEKLRQSADGITKKALYRSEHLPCRRNALCGWNR